MSQGVTTSSSKMTETQLTGPSPAYKRVGCYRPKMVGPISARQVFWGGPDPTHKCGLGRIRACPPSKLMVLSLHAEYILHAMATRMGQERGRSRGRHLTRVGGAAGLGG